MEEKDVIYKKNTKLEVGFWLIAVIILLWKSNDLILELYINTKVSNIIKNNDYSVEAVFLNAEILKANTTVFWGSRSGSAKVYQNSITIKLLESNKKIRIPEFNDTKMYQYKQYKNQQVKVCKLMYKDNKKSKNAEEYIILCEPTRHYYFFNRGIQYIYNTDFNDIIKLNEVGGEVYPKVTSSLLEISEENKPFYESTQNLKCTYESNYGECYIYNRDNTWHLFLKHPGKYCDWGEEKDCYGIILKLEQEYSEGITKANIKQKFETILAQKNN